MPELSGRRLAPGPESRHQVIAAMVVATVASVYPGFLIGALSVQVSAEFDVSEAAYGWGLGGFFLAATVGSVVLGRMAQRIGPRRQIAALTATSVVAQLLIATAARSFAAVVALLVVCGLANAGNQAAVNLALTRAAVPQLGLAIALKQSGMPAASMLSGLAVPGLALTFGWRWGFVLGAAIGAATVVWVLRILPSEPSAPGRVRTAEGTAEPDRQKASTPLTPRRILWWTAAAGGLMSFGAGALNAWLVPSGVDAGLGEGAAGALLAVGAACGISLRLYSGTRLDAMASRPFTVGGATAAIGAFAMAALALRSPGSHVVATLFAFGAGWIWPVFTNFGIVRRNADAAAAATGVTQMGVYVGVFSAPVITGPIIDAAGYEIMWLVVGSAVVTGALIALGLAREF